jgi:hypothetical protein
MPCPWIKRLEFVTMGMSSKLTHRFRIPRRSLESGKTDLTVLGKARDPRWPNGPGEREK